MKAGSRNAVIVSCKKKVIIGLYERRCRSRRILRRSPQPSDFCPFFRPSISACTSSPAAATNVCSSGFYSIAKRRLLYRFNSDMYSRPTWYLYLHSSTLLEYKLWVLVLIMLFCYSCTLWMTVAGKVRTHWRKCGCNGGSGTQPRSLKEAGYRPTMQNARYRDRRVSSSPLKCVSYTAIIVWSEMSEETPCASAERSQLTPCIHHARWVAAEQP